MENQSFNERHSLTGNSGLLGLTNLTRTKLQPVRVKQLLEMCGSDEEDSEERGKDSDNESDGDDIQPLPDDDEESHNTENSPAKESNEISKNHKTIAPLLIANEQIEEQQNSSPNHKIKEDKHISSSENLHFTSNFVSNEQSDMKLENHRSESLPSDSALADYFAGCSAQKSSIENNHRLNPKFKPPDALLTSTNKSSYALVSSKSESILQSVHSIVKSKFEAQESNFFTNDQHLLTTNVDSQSETPAISTASANVQNANYLITDTPHKNNPPIGSMRPTPSISHRSMFQTPQSAKLRHQDYSKNHVQTPATIFSNWSQRHMSQTPLQNRSTILSSDSSRSQIPSNIVTQHTTATAGSTHENHWYQNTEEKKLRKPLAETMQSSLNHKRHSHNEKPSNAQSNADSSAASSKHHENSPLENQQTHSILENIKEQCSNKSAHQQHQMLHESKENRHPTPLIDKLKAKDEEQGKKENFNRHPTPLIDKLTAKDEEQGKRENFNRHSTPLTDKLTAKDEEQGKRENFNRHPLINKSTAKDEEQGKRENLNRHPTPSIDKLTTKDEEQGKRENLNRHPTPLTDKLTAKDEEQGKKENVENIKESKRLSSNGNIPNENRVDSTRHKVENSDVPTSRSVRTSNSDPLKNTASETVIEKNVAPKQQANVQLSIPSNIRRVNPGEMMIVKGKEYLILGGLGQGMSCYVLRVQDLTNLELRAIKVVNLSRMDKDSAHGCIQEISMLHKLQAPCVVRMFDYEIKYPMVHVVMEMGDTDFKSLLTSMTENKRLPLTMILYYWTEMLTAVKHIHENGVIHSDLKPANFLLVRGRLKLIDFGIASSINADMTSVVKNTPIGTLNYISPEALMDIGGGGSDSPNHNVKYKITFKSDVWSLGCILYSLIYGYTPFNNFRSQWAKIQAITSPIPNISFTLPAGNDVEPPPAILIDVLRKCLQHDPKARPTVTQLLQIPYITTKSNPHAPLREIPSNIVLKIRHSLTDDEWRQFKEIMEQRRNES